MELEDFACVTWFDSLNKIMGTAERMKKSSIHMDDITDDCLKNWATEICENVSYSKQERTGSYSTQQSLSSEGSR